MYVCMYLCTLNLRIHIYLYLKSGVIKSSAEALAIVLQVPILSKFLLP